MTDVNKMDIETFLKVLNSKEKLSFFNDNGISLNTWFNWNDGYTPNQGKLFFKYRHEARFVETFEVPVREAVNHLVKDKNQSIGDRCTFGTIIVENVIIVLVRHQYRRRNGGGIDTDWKIIIDANDFSFIGCTKPIEDRLSGY